MSKALTALITAVLLALAATAGAIVLQASDLDVRPNDVIWFDDIEGDVSGWRTVDFTAEATPQFHWDQYMAFGGEGYSWWCGTFEYDSNGGYGNLWDERLDLPPVDLSTNSYPVLTYAFRHDMYDGYDFTYLQAESSGVYVNLARYGGHRSWHDIGTYGFLLFDYDSPFKCRFRFISSLWWSDEDGYHDSVGGAFACDNIKIYDYLTGEVHFYDSEPGSDRENECTPSVPAPSGDYWHVIDRACPALSDPHSWWCGDDSDTGLIPPNLRNGLYSPVIDLTPYGTVVACTVHFAQHQAIPIVDQDFCQHLVTCDGQNYFNLGWLSTCNWLLWGDFGQCDGWNGTLYNLGYDVGQFCSEGEITHAGFLWVMHTTENGCGPGEGGDAGVMIDDVWFEIEVLNPVEEASWGQIKSLFR